MRAAFFAPALAVACFTLTAAARPDPKVQVSPEMKDFMKGLDGTEKGVNAALKKYAAEGVDTSKMAGIMVREPKVTKAETKGGMTCYTMDCKTGILDRTYLICWKDKKIREIKQLSVK